MIFVRLLTSDHEQKNKTKLRPYKVILSIKVFDSIPGSAYLTAGIFR